ncbi:MAG: hypothetical protein ACP5QK_12630 [Myxococcota bacterium]
MGRLNREIEINDTEINEKIVDIVYYKNYFKGEEVDIIERLR